MELTKEQKRIILENSPERVLNTAIKIVERSKHGDAQMNSEDLEFIKPIVRKLWDEARSQIQRGEL